ncbi:family 43 glycosylhydrolase [Paenibacillus mucilaginosus]|uniref:family 43 glycosylhydrolase n=1 Tax=Paenibacillus mucilaginosus TaxID=61624 RepID=UPI0009DB2C99|nr:family 43 glycosylhydrolase [Paenibacillus mucilaginosus]MCG7213187.1 family 43 glycosylhydrolase [Paenibacillus mucilaginosus]WDM29646.1 family 43 glycosylhydrolase [Paenibacillus mucilaginosus]
MVISARSKHPWGPFENSPYNPIIRTESRDERWCSRGHGTLVDTPDGDWWMVYHAYEKNYYTLGRQTLLEPIEWTEDGWFRVPSGVSPDKPIRKPKGSAAVPGRPKSETSDGLGLQWSFFKEHDKDRYAVTGEIIELQASERVSPLVYMPEDHHYEVQVEVTIQEGSQGRLLLFYNTTYFSGMGISADGLYGILRGWHTPCIPYSGSTVHLRLCSADHEVIYYYSHDGGEWTKFPHSFEASGFHHNALGGFLALRIGLDALGQGKATFRNFQYRSL